MQVNGAPQPVKEAVITQDQLLDVEIMINRGSLEPLGPYDNLLFSANNPGSYRRNYMQLRINGYNHEESLTISWRLDGQYGYLSGKYESEADKKTQAHEVIVFYYYSEYMSSGAIDGNGFAKLARVGGDLKEVSRVQEDITRAHPNIDRFMRQDILRDFIDLRCDETKPLKYKEAVESACAKVNA